MDYENTEFARLCRKLNEAKTFIEYQDIEDQIAMLPNTGFIDVGQDEVQEGCPDHVIDENKLDQAVVRLKERESMDDFLNTTYNWSGLQ